MTFESIDKSLEMAKSEHVKFKGGNKAACTRCRSHLQTIKKTCDQLRKDCMNSKKQMVVKPRSAKISPA